MANLKSVRILLALAAALALTVVAAMAKSHSATINIPYSGTLSGTAIEAGKYDLAWEEHSPEVTVTLSKGKEVAATARGRIEERARKYNRNQVLYSTDASGNQAISEIRLAGTNRAIVFVK
jgi:hypothetical protein